MNVQRRSPGWRTAAFRFGAQLKTATSKQRMVSHEERHGFRWRFAAFERAGGRVGRILQVRSQNEGEGGDDGDHETQGPEAKEGERGRGSQSGGIVTKLNGDLLWLRRHTVPFSRDLNRTVDAARPATRRCGTMKYSATWSGFR